MLTKSFVPNPLLRTPTKPTPIVQPLPTPEPTPRPTRKRKSPGTSPPSTSDHHVFIGRVCGCPPFVFTNRGKLRRTNLTWLKTGHIDELAYECELQEVSGPSGSNRPGGVISEVIDLTLEDRDDDVVDDGDDDTSRVAGVESVRRSAGKGKGKGKPRGGDQNADWSRDQQRALWKAQVNVWCSELRVDR